MRALIESRLLRLADTGTQPVQSMQVDGGGPMSAQLRELLAGPHRRAAVLIGLIDRPAGLQLVLTRRAVHLPRHAGQVAFPGGHIESSDSGPAAAALREAHEEIGLHPEEVELVGALGEHLTGTGYAVTPFVGFIRPSFVAMPDPGEVAGVFEVPLEFAFGPDGLHECVHERYGTRLRGYELNYAGERVWGATAAMLATFRNILYES